MAEDKRFQDHAEELNQLMDQINSSSDGHDEELISSDNKTNSDEMDLLNLPPRSETHANTDKKTKFKFKIKYPLVRLLFVLFILIVVLVLTFDKWWGKELLDSPGLIKAENQHPAGEMVKISSIADEFQHSDTTVEQKKLPHSENSTAKDNIINSENKEAIEGDEEPFYYLVKKGDTLQSIALMFYETERGETLIMEANQLTNNHVTVGQRLIIPKYPKHGK